VRTLYLAAKIIVSGLNTFFSVSVEWRRRGMHIGYWWESHEERDHREDQYLGGWTVLRWSLER
jgi:hypothetical protein